VCNLEEFSEASLFKRSTAISDGGGGEESPRPRREGREVEGNKGHQRGRIRRFIQPCLYGK